MKLTLDIVQIVLAVLLMAAVLLQAKGSGLGAAFGEGQGVATTRRGAEKGLFITTIVLATLFVALAAVRMFIG